MAIEFTVDHDHAYAGEDGVEPLIGWITFSVSTYPGDFRAREQGAEGVRTLNLPARHGWLAADGHLYKDQTLEMPFRLVANDPTFNLKHLTYRVDFALATALGDPVAVPLTYFPAPGTDTTLYLTRVMADLPQQVMEVRTKGYMEDILDAGEAGIALLGAPDAAAARAEIDAASPSEVADLISEQDIPGQIVDAIAADTTVVDAAAAAVTADIAGRNLVEAIDGWPIDAAGGLVGDNGYGTDLLIDANGELLVDTLSRWLSRFQTLGVPETLDSNWFGTGFVASDGTATELVTDTLGRVPEWVLAAWAQRMPAAASAIDPAEIVLPTALYMVTGQTYRLEYAKIIAAYSRDYDVVVTTNATDGTGNNGTYWEHTPAAETTFTLTVTLKNRSGETVTTAATSVYVLDAPVASTLRHLAIGDSITRFGEYVEGAVETILSGTTVGIRTFADDDFRREGRGGWTLPRFCEDVGTTGGDSPFVFPDTVISGAEFWGNTDFWRKVTVDDPGGYDFDGFQKIARGWATTGNPYLFDSTGYPTAPTAGDVVVDPAQSAGSEWQEYNGATWVAMSPQPGTELSFSKYIDRYSAAFPGGNPTCVSILLATNDFLQSASDEDWLSYSAYLDQFIAAVRAWDAAVPIILIGAPSPGPDDTWAGVTTGNNTLNRVDFQRHMVEFSRRLYGNYDTVAARDNHVYVTSFLGVVSDASMSDFVHPGTDGHTEMAPWLAGLLAHLINEGEI